MNPFMMEQQELRAIANYFRSFHGADSFLAALACARRLADGGELQTASVWNQIAEEISQAETSDILRRCLERGPQSPAPAVPEHIAAAGG